MILNVKCPSCGEPQRLSDDMVGHKLTCPSCGTGFRVAAPKSAAPAAPAEPAPKAAAPGPAPRPPQVPPQAQARSTAPQVSSPAPVTVPPDPIGAPPRGGPAPWIYGVGGGATVALVAAVVIAIRTLGGSAASQDGFPDPSVDIALGVVSPAGPAMAAVAPTPTPTAAAPAPAAAPAALAAGNVSPAPTAAAAPVAATPPPAMLTAAAAPTPAPTAAAPAGGVTPAAPPAAAPTTSPTPSARGPSLSTAQIVAKWEPSVALVKGQTSVGTGFLVAPGIVATNAHVIDEEFVSGLEIRFPSAPEGKQGPSPAELLYEDPRRDLAFLKVATDLPAIEVAPSYSFVKGEDVTVIGNPGLGEDIVLENAISRGVMSSKATLEGLNFFQMNIAVNPGNSGGPVFDSSGRVIGVVTLKSNKTEAMAFCIPVEELRTSMATLGTAHPEVASSHRAQVAFKLLTAMGAIESIGLEIRAAILRQTPAGQKPNLLPNEGIQKLDEGINALNEKLYATVEGEIGGIRSDNALTAATRGRYQDLWANYKAMNALYGSTNTKRTAAQFTQQVRDLRMKYIRLIESLQKDLKAEVPAQLLAILKTTVIDGQQPQAVIAQIVPAPMQSRMLRGRSRVIQRNGPGPSAGARPSPAQSAKDRMQSAKDRMQNLRDRRRGGN